MTPEEQGQHAILKTFAADLEKRQRERRWKEKSRVWKPTATSATQLGWDCERRIVYQRVLPWWAEAPSEELASIFCEGEFHEKQVVREAEDQLGVKIRERSSTFRDQRLDIVGQLDFEMFVEGVGWIPTEVKGLQSVPGADVEGEDLAEGTPLHRRYSTQVLTYLLLRAKMFGAMIVKSKGNGLWRVLVIPLDFERGEVVFKKAERVRDAVRAYIGAFETVTPFTQDGPDTPDEKNFRELHLAGSWDQAMAAAEPHLPARIFDRSECGQCPFKKRCNPSEAPIDPALLIDDEFLANKIRRHEKAKPARDEYERVHEELKERFKLTKGDVFFCSEYRIAKRPHGKGVRLEFTNQQPEKEKDLGCETA